MNIADIQSLFNLPSHQELSLEWNKPRMTEWEKVCADRAATLQGLMIERDWGMCQQLINEWQAESVNHNLTGAGG